MERFSGECVKLRFCLSDQVSFVNDHKLLARELNAETPPPSPYFPVGVVCCKWRIQYIINGLNWRAISVPGLIHNGFALQCSGRFISPVSEVWNTVYAPSFIQSYLKSNIIRSIKVVPNKFLTMKSHATKGIRKLIRQLMYSRPSLLTRIIRMEYNHKQHIVFTRKLAHENDL